MSDNLDRRTVADFGREWQAFDYADADQDDLQAGFDAYFQDFPWDRLSSHAVGFDLGCGSGRWARLLAGRVATLLCFDASPAALAVAGRNLAAMKTTALAAASAGRLPLADRSMDFGVSLGVLHHVPDTAAAIADCARVLKPGAPLLLYLYYRFDNRPVWFRALWRASDLMRRAIAGLPFRLKQSLCAALAVLVYWPLARLAALGERCGATVDGWPLSAYRRRPFYIMRTDALDRFGTRLEQRFTRVEIRVMLQAAGLHDPVFGRQAPYWCVVSYKGEG
ncbi:MAG: class I SAM-dependent methyltransferase [Alphaproteobacteria bacterium]